MHQNLIDDTNGATDTLIKTRRNSTKPASSALSPEIIAGIEAAVRRKYVDPNAEAFSIDEFCSKYGIGRQLVYDEINASRLTAVKAGRRT